VAEFAAVWSGVKESVSRGLKPEFLGGFNVPDKSGTYLRSKSQEQKEWTG
jgi:hypothetical protein